MTCKEQETTWNDPQRVRHNLQQPEPTYNEQKKDAKRPTLKNDWMLIILRFSNWIERFSNLLRLKELRNCISFIFRVRSLFCLVRVYVSLHFLPIPLENKVIVFLCVFFFCFCFFFWIRCDLRRLKNIWLIIQVFFLYFIFTLHNHTL